MQALATLRRFRNLATIVPVLLLAACGQGDGPDSIANEPVTPLPPVAPGFCDPINFEIECPDPTIVNFNGGATIIVDNPDKSGINTSDLVARMQKFPDEVFGGTLLDLGEPVDFSEGEFYTMKVWSSRAVPVSFKLEEQGNPAGGFTVVQDHSGSGTWEELCFDVTAQAVPTPVVALTIIFDNGVLGAADTNPDDWTFYYDDITQVESCAAGGGPADIQPDAALFSSSGDSDLVIPDDYAERTPFGSGSVIDPFYADDDTFSPVLSVFSGTGYGANVAQIGFIGFSTGFLTNYDSVDFKVKGMPGFVIFVKLFDGVDTLRLNLTSSSYSKELADGWFQVSIPVADFGGADQATGIVFESDSSSEMQFRMLLTDIGFSGTGDRVPADPGVLPDVVIYSSSAPADLEFGVDYTGYEPFGSGSTFDSNVTSDLDFSPVFGVTTGDGYGAQVGQFAIVGFDAGFASTYETLDFKAKGLNNDFISVKFLDGGDYLDIVLTGSPFSTDLGNGWYQVSIPLTSLTGVDTATALLFETDSTAVDPFTFLLTDIGFSGAADGGSDGGSADNIAVNGGFETGTFAGWEQVPTDGTQVIVTDNPASGVYAANLVVPVRGQSDPGLDNVIKNANLEAGNLTPGAAVTVSFDMRGTLSGAGGVVFAELFSELSGGGTSKAELLGGGPLTPTADWVTYSFDTTLGPDVSGGVTLQLKASCGAVEGCGVDVFFDNVSIVVGGTDGNGGTGGADPGTVPDVVIYSSSAAPDLEFGVDYTGYEPFGSGSTFDSNVTSDPDFSPAFGVTTGDGYGAQVGQFAIVGFDAGFASTYETLDFKAKGLNNDLIRVRFLDAGDYLDIVLTGSPFSTDLGNGWYQVSIPLTSFTGVDTATGLLFETDDTAANPFTFLLTDIGFSGSTGPADSPDSIVPEDVIFATDPTVPAEFEFGVDYTGYEAFGSGSVFNSTFADDPDFSPVFAVTSGTGYGANVGQFGIVGFTAGFASVYETLDFKVKGMPGDVIRIKFLDDGDYVVVALATSEYSTALGNGWYQVSIPLTLFTGVDTATGLLFESTDTSPVQFTFLLTDFGFSGTATGGGGGGELLTNGDFEASDTDKAPWVNAGAIATNNYYTVDASAGGNVFDTNLSQVLDITQDTEYVLTFRARASVAREIVAGIGLNVQPFTAVTVNVPLTTDWQSFSYNLTATGFGGADSRVLFDMGTVASTVDIDDVSLTVAGSTGGGGGGGVTGDIAINGGFETGTFDGWEQLPGEGSQAIVTDNPSSGVYAANLLVPVRTQTDPAVDNLLKNPNLEAGNLASNEPVTVSFDMRGTLSGAGGVIFAELFSELSGGGTSKSEILSGGPLTPTVDWTTYSFNTTLGPDVSGGVTLQLKASCGPVEGCGVDVFFDNVSIVIGGTGGGTGGGGDTGGGDTGGGDTGAATCTGGGGTSGGSGTGGGAPGGIAVNGGFETGTFDGWEQLPGGGSQAILTDNPSSGIYAANLLVPIRTQTDPAVDNLLKNSNLEAGSLTSNAPVTVSFDMRGELCGAGGVVFAEFFSELTGGGTSKSEILGGGAPLTPVANWTNYSFNTTLGSDVSGGVTLQLKASCGPVEGCGVDVVFDNVSIVIN